MDGASDGVAGECAEDKALGEDALAGEGRVAMYGDGQNAIAAGLVRAVGVARCLADAGLLRAGAAEGDGIDRLQVAGVGDQVQVDGCAVGSMELAGGPHVVFDVATAEHRTWVHIFEAREDVDRGASNDIGHYVEAAAMAHGYYRGGDTKRSAGGEDMGEERDKDSEPFQREALGAEVARLDGLLEEVRADEVREDAGLVGGRGRQLHLLLEPLARGRVRDVHELQADAAAVNGAGGGGDCRVGGGSGEWLGREVLAERVERGLEVSPAAEYVEDGFALGGVRRD